MALLLLHKFVVSESFRSCFLDSSNYPFRSFLRPLRLDDDDDRPRRRRRRPKRRWTWRWCCSWAVSDFSNSQSTHIKRDLGHSQSFRYSLTHSLSVSQSDDGRAGWPAGPHAAPGCLLGSHLDGSFRFRGQELLHMNRTDIAPRFFTHEYEFRETAGTKRVRKSMLAPRVERTQHTEALTTLQPDILQLYQLKLSRVDFLGFHP